MPHDLADNAVDYDPDADGWVYMLHVPTGSLDPDIDTYPEPEDVPENLRDHFYIGKTLGFEERMNDHKGKNHDRKIPDIPKVTEHGQAVQVWVKENVYYEDVPDDEPAKGNHDWPERKRQLNGYLRRRESEIHEEMDEKLEDTPVISIATGGR